MAAADAGSGHVEALVEVLVVVLVGVLVDVGPYLGIGIAKRATMVGKEKQKHSHKHETNKS